MRYRWARFQYRAQIAEHLSADLDMTEREWCDLFILSHPVLGVLPEWPAPEDWDVAWVAAHDTATILGTSNGLPTKEVE